MRANYRRAREAAYAEGRRAFQQLRRVSPKRRRYSIQYHADQDLEALRAFWGAELGIDAADIRMQRESNSNQLAGRTWRPEHGVLAVTVNDTLPRARIGGWTDSLRESWA